MTPQERARQIDKEEFEAECKAIRRRAYNLLKRKPKRDPRVQACIDRGLATSAVPFNKPGTRGPKSQIYLTYKGETKTLPEWASITGISYGTIATRIRCGWTPERIIETPTRHRAKPESKGEVDQE